MRKLPKINTRIANRPERHCLFSASQHHWIPELSTKSGLSPSSHTLTLLIQQRTLTQVFIRDKCFSMVMVYVQRYMTRSQLFKKKVQGAHGWAKVHRFSGWGIRTPEYEALAKSPPSAARWEEWPQRPLTFRSDKTLHLTSAKATAVLIAKEPCSGDSRDQEIS